MAGWQYHVTPDGVKELLRGGGEFNTSERILSGLTAEQAYRTPPGSPYCIAQVVAHLHYWQERSVAAAQGEKRPRPDHLNDTFAAPPPEQWPQLATDFLAGIGRAGEVAAAQADATSPSRDDTSLPYDLAESALHNAYHLGQIVLLRQMLGLWPPTGGDENDF